MACRGGVSGNSGALSGISEKPGGAADGLVPRRARPMAAAVAAVKRLQWRSSQGCPSALNDRSLLSFCSSSA